MLNITYTAMVGIISILWLIARAFIWKKNKKINWKRELQLMLVYIPILVVVRFTFCPFVYLFDYPNVKEALLNFIGNTAMFIPIGAVWPIVFKELDTHKKVIAAGVGFSLIIEILQLPFYDRVSDIDDLMLNSLGYIMGYGIYLLVKKIKRAGKN